MQVKMRKLKESHPILLCLIIVIAFWAVSALTKLIDFNTQEQYATNLAREILLSVFAVITALTLIGKSVLSERHCSFFRGLSVAAFPIALSAFVILSGILNPPASLLPLSSIIIFLLFVILVGIAEEFVFRGSIVNILAEKYAKTEKGVYFTVFASGILFGAIHLVNIFSGIDILGAVIQAICVIPIGCLYTAIYLRTKSIWLLVFTHALNDFGGLVSAGLYGVETIESAISSYSPLKLVSIILYLIPVFYLLRKSKVEEIISKNI